MSHQQPNGDQQWLEAEALVERVERESREFDAGFFQNTADGLRLVLGGAVRIWVRDQDADLDVIAQSGLGVFESPDGEFDYRSAPVQWNVAADSVFAQTDLGDGLRLGVNVRLEEPIDFSKRHLTSDLIQVILDCVGDGFLRREAIRFREQQRVIQDQDRWIFQMNSGTTLKESFTRIASAIAERVSADRVSLLCAEGRQYRLLGCSTQASIDPRSAQVRALQKLASIALQDSQGLHYQQEAGSVEQGSPSMAVLQDYCQRSECKEIYLHAIKTGDSSSIRVALILERFADPLSDGKGSITNVEAVMRSALPAINLAVRRNQVADRFGVARFVRRLNPVRMSLLGLSLFVLTIAMMMVPVPLRIPADGVLRASNSRHIFASAGGTIQEILVQNGQEVGAGDILVQLRSSELELEMNRLEGELSTARARLGALSTSRSQNRSSQQASLEASSNSQVLESQIKGLTSQLKIVQDQQKALTITSPIDGHVDAWDLQESLVARPVDRGQHLMDIVAKNKRGWIAEIEVPDHNIGYLLKHRIDSDLEADIRLRSDPSTTFGGTVREIANVANLDSQGRSHVRVRVELHGTASDFRPGATVIADIDCGTRSVGFVLLRGFIQWWRTQAWY